MPRQSDKEYLAGLVFVKRLPNGEMVTRPQVLEAKYRDSLSPELVGEVLSIHARTLKDAKRRFIETLPYHRELMGEGRIRVKTGGRTLFL